MDLLDLAHFHVRHGQVVAGDHLSQAAHEFQRLAPVVGGVELGAVVEGAAVVGAAGLSHVLALDPGLGRAAAVAACAAAPTGGSFKTVGIFFVVVMVAVGAGVDQFAPQIGLHGLVRASGCACADLDAGFFQGRLSARAEAAADQHVDGFVRQQARQRFMAAAVGTHHLGGQHFAVFHVVDLELFRMSEVLEHFAVFVSNCNFHEKLLKICHSERSEESFHPANLITKPGFFQYAVRQMPRR